VVIHGPALGVIEAGEEAHQFVILECELWLGTAVNQGRQANIVTIADAADGRDTD
jgi:hypothetical protein